MDLKPRYQRKVNISFNIQQESEKLINKMRTNDIKMDTLPNTYENYTGKLEVEDYLSFCMFLESRRGKLVLELTEDNV